jgi:hypothetical protein
MPARRDLEHMTTTTSGAPVQGRVEAGWDRVDPDAAVGFGYVTNLWSFRIGEPRASSLAAAVVACLE